MQLRRLQDIIDDQSDTIIKRDETLRHMERVMERASSRYANLLAKEHQRLETNVSIGTQKSTEIAEFGQQVDLILSSSTLSTDGVLLLQHPPVTSSSARAARLMRVNVNFTKQK